MLHLNVFFKVGSILTYYLKQKLPKVHSLFHVAFLLIEGINSNWKRPHTNMHIQRFLYKYKIISTYFSSKCPEFVLLVQINIKKYVKINKRFIIQINQRPGQTATRLTIYKWSCLEIIIVRLVFVRLERQVKKTNPEACKI